MNKKRLNMNTQNNVNKQKVITHSYIFLEIASPSWFDLIWFYHK